MTELINTRCAQGRLIITENVIKVRLLNLKEQSLSRSSLTGITSEVKAPAIFGFGGGTNLVFLGQGTELRVTMVKTSVADEIKELLGY